MTVSHRRLAPLLAAAVALIPLALDAYLPAFPGIARDLGVSYSEVGLTLSVYVFLLAIGQLVGGPLSDRFGRRRILFAGLAIFVVGSLAVAGAASLPSMLAARALQAFGGGWVAVSVPAIVRDRTSGMETARLFSLIALIMFMAPALAPTLGSLLLPIADWPGIFLFLAAYGLLVGALLQVFLFRHLRPAPRAPRQPLHTLVTNYGAVIHHRTAMLLIALQALAFSVMLIYLTHAPFLLQHWLGLDNTGFSSVFALNVATMASIALLNRRLLLRYRPAEILAVAVPIQCLSVGLLLGVLALPVPRWLLIPALMAVIGSMGAISPNVQASVMQFFRERGGTAAALLGAVQFAGGGLVSAAVALIVSEQAARVGLAMLVCSGLATVVTPMIVRRLKPTQTVD